jgi:hypothetical protein
MVNDLLFGAIVALEISSYAVKYYFFGNYKTKFADPVCQKAAKHILYSPTPLDIFAATYHIFKIRNLEEKIGA